MAASDFPRNPLTLEVGGEPLERHPDVPGSSL